MRICAFVEQAFSSSRATGRFVIDAVCSRQVPHCEIGRIRKNYALDKGLCCQVSRAQELKGTALNTVQIAEELVK